MANWLVIPLAAHAVGQQNADYTKRGQYEPLGNGININKNDGTVQVFGLSHTKVVLMNGVFDPVNSKPLTIAKQKIVEQLTVGKFREFALDVGNVDKIVMQGETLILNS